MELVIGADGCIRTLYSEEIDLAVLGPLSITRASNVEPDADGQWLADLSPMGGPQLGPFPSRSVALQLEREWLAVHWLGVSS